MIYFLVILGTYILHMGLRLNWIVTGIVGAYLLAMIPLHRSFYRRYRMQLRRFEDTGVYIDSLLYSFVKEGKVIRAFENVAATLGEGQMKELVSFDNSQLLSGAMEHIEEEYKCERIKTIHRFMTSVEFYGGDIEEPVGLLLEDKNRWVKRIDTAIAERKKMFTEIILSVAASLFICGMILYIPVMNVDITGNWIVQILSGVVIIIDQLIILAGQKWLATDWLLIDEMESEDYYCKKMEEYGRYDEKKDKKLSVFLSLTFFAGAGICLYFGMKWANLLCLVLAAISMNQHRIGRHLAKKRLSKNISSAFPKWLLDMALLLQSENVHMALVKSLEKAPMVLKKELRELVGRLEINPESAAPYHKFLKDFQLPEVHSAMGMLYGLSVGNSGSSGKQISELISRNLDMMDRADTERIRDKNSGMYLLFLAPVLTASMKLLCDMAMFLLAFLQVRMV